MKKSEFLGLLSLIAYSVLLIAAGKFAGSIEACSMMYYDLWFLRMIGSAVIVLGAMITLIIGMRESEKLRREENV